MSIKCCNRQCQILEEIDLWDTVGQTHRFLVIGRCRNEKCGALKAQLIYYDLVKQKFVHETIKGPDIKKTIDLLKSNPDVQIKNDKQGNYQDQNWIYGKTRYCTIDGRPFIEHWACNFNGEKRLVERREL